MSWCRIDKLQACSSALGNDNESWKWQNLGRNPACTSRSVTPRAIYWILILKCTFTGVNVQFSCHNSYLFQTWSYLKNFVGHNSQSPICPRSSRLQAKDESSCHVSSVELQGERGKQLRPGFQQCLWQAAIQRLPDQCPGHPGTPTLLDANLQYQDALDWRKIEVK